MHRSWVYLQAHHLFFLPLHLLHADWDRDQPSLPFKSHKTINLTSTDHPTLLGPPETKTANTSLDFTSRIVTESVVAKEPPTLPLVVSGDIYSVDMNLSRFTKFLTFSLAFQLIGQ